MSDPLERVTDLSHFRTRGYLAGGVVTNARREDLDLGALPPFLRTLLVTDGTVTKSLEAWFWEPVRVRTLGQHRERLPKPEPWLEMEAGGEMLHRQVVLEGQQSGRLLVFADSAIRLERLPARLREALLAERIGIGELLRECGLETYREILELGERHDAPIAALLGRPAGCRLIYRTYRINQGGEPAILITEYFPLALYGEVG